MEVQDEEVQQIVESPARSGIPVRGSHWGSKKKWTSKFSKKANARRKAAKISRRKNRRP
jgi:hypothetical protein